MANSTPLAVRSGKRIGDVLCPTKGYCPSRIERTADTLTTAIENVGVTHCRANILMSQQFLHRADTITIFEQMCGKAVAKRMTTSMFGNSSLTNS
jgi:hypothetical protein